MMPDLHTIYDRAFFEEWGPGNEKYVAGARQIVETLLAEFRPSRVVDVGCGCGVYAHWFAHRGVETVSIDGVLPPPAHSFGAPTAIRDLTVPFANEWGRFDFALCLEVAEHIPEPLAPAFLDNLVQFSDTVLLSAAPVGQGGHHHVNERPKRYWVRRLAEKGYVYDRPATGRLMEIFKRDKVPFMWMVEHISVYRKAASSAELSRTLPFAVDL